MLGSDKDIDNKNRARLGGWEYAGWGGGCGCDFEQVGQNSPY